MLEYWNTGTFEQTCLRKPHEQVVGRTVGANNIGIRMNIHYFSCFIILVCKAMFLFGRQWLERKQNIPIS